MNDLLRQEVASVAHTLVIKVGTRVLTHPCGTLDLERIAWLGEEICDLIATGRQVVLVSSGAVGAGMSQLKLSERPRDVAQLQAVAAVGQANLIEAYDHTFRQHGRIAAQVLLTAEDLNDRTRYLNVRNTLRALSNYGAVPVINENDTVAVDELVATFGDNDRLAALVTNLLRAPLLIILSDVEGLYTGAPHEAGSTLVHTVSQLGPEIVAYVRDVATGLSKGGMASKLEAARMATAAGENVIIASGRRPSVLQEIMAGREVGTLVLAQGKSISPRKRWIGFSAHALRQAGGGCGRPASDCRAGRSLLAIGIVRAEGSFRKGDLVTLCDESGSDIGRGLTNYHADEIGRIKGLRSDRIAQVLGHCPYDEVIHRDNMTVLDP